jgi:hypothetical protein
MINNQFVLSADYIKTGELNADLITAGALVIKDSDNETILSANTAGSVTIGGWKVGKGYLYADSYGYVGLYSNSPYITIAG